MARIDFAVPTHDNHGSPFPGSYFDDFDIALCGLAGGYTAGGPVAGGWMGPYGIQREPSRSYTLYVTPERAEPVAAQLEAWIKGPFRQLAACIAVTLVRTTVM